MQLKSIVRAIALLGATLPVWAQTPDAPQRVEITGSSIKRIASEGALPVQVISRKELESQGIVNAEQLISAISSNGTGLDNLASNADVVAGAARGGNGLSAANLRGQGAAATLVLLNGRRVAAHGLNGGVVDLNSIPFAAVDRVEVLKDGASSMYGTDAIGGVINFILRRDYRGLEANLFEDVTQHGGGNIARFSLTGGHGNLDTDRFNILFTLSHSENKALRGDQRAFVNTFQPDRGLSVDTRGTPYATIFAIGSLYNGLSRDNTPVTDSKGVTTYPGRGVGPTLPATGTQTYNGINVLDLPGQAGCNSVDGMAAYDEKLWAAPASAYGCAWDTGRAAVLQQPVKNTSGVLRGTLRLGEHQLTAEYVASRVETHKSFSPNQLSSSTSTTSFFYNMAYPSTGAAYDSVFNALVKAFPQLEANRGQPLPLRWRCMPCGNREIGTTADNDRFVLSAEGPLVGGWDYRAGLLQATNTTTSVLGSGYYYGKELAGLVSSGTLNPFLAAGQSQTAAALAALDAISANGVTLYGGKYTLQQADFTATGPVFKLPAGDVTAAVGLDARTEKYQFNGNATDLTTQARIYNAPFDSVNTLAPVKRDIKAVFAEVLVPIAKSFDVTLAARHDDYTGFGTTDNPKVSFRFQPLSQLMMRGSFGTGFRVPTFNQQFFGVTESTYSGKDLVDPAKCASGKVDATVVGCESITPIILTGGKQTLGPETSRQWTVGFVFEPVRDVSVGADLWQIRRKGTIQTLSQSDLIANYKLFPENFIRDASGTLLAIDERWINAGETITRGIDVNAQAGGTLGDGRWRALLDGTYLLDKRSRLIASAPMGASEVAQFTRAGDLGLRWKHSLTGTYTLGPWTAALTQVFRSGYKDAVLPGVANGTIVPANWNPNVEAYTVYNASVAYTGIKNLGVTLGIKNLFDKDPPFSAAYDSNTGAGSSWEPRVADPRGRAFTFMVNYKFF